MDPQQKHDRLWDRLTAPRIDAICVRRGMIYLVEVEVELHWQAVAQTILYHDLWQLLYPHLQIERPIIACQVNRPDIAEAALSLNIDVVVVS